RMKARGRQVRRVPDVMQPSGGFHQVGMLAEHSSEGPRLFGYPLGMRPASGKRLFEQFSRELPRPVNMSHMSRLTRGGFRALDEPSLTVHGDDEPRAFQLRESLTSRPARH